jgi:hypothetical protein
MILFYQPLNPQICPNLQVWRRETVTVETSGSPKAIADSSSRGAER